MKRSFAAIILVFIILSCFLVETAFAGAWTLPKYKVWGEYYMKWDYATQMYDANWTRRTMTYGNGGRSWGYTMEPKLEYGATDWFTLMSSLQYKQYTYKEYSRPPQWGPFERKNHGVTYTMVGGRLRLIAAPVIVSVQAREFIYVGGYGIDHGDDPFFNSNQPGLGFGNNTFDLRGIVSKSFILPLSETVKFPSYASVEVGYDWNNWHVCNGVPYFAEVGIEFYPSLTWKNELDGYKSHDGTGSLNEIAYGIWRTGLIWSVFGGDETLRRGNKAFNLEFQYGHMLWGKSVSAYDELVLKVQTSF